MHRSAAQGRRVGQGHRDWCIHGHTGVCWAYGADQDEKLGGLREAAAFELVTVAPCSPLLGALIILQLLGATFLIPWEENFSNREWVKLSASTGRPSWRETELVVSV